MSPATMHVLFVCTGNIFRSMTAEYALTHMPALPDDIVVSSAGTIDAPHGILDFVSAHMAKKSIDVSHHKPRKLTREIINSADLAVAMGEDHQSHVSATFERDIPLFNRVAFGHDEPMKDVWEVLPDWRTTDHDAGRAYAWDLMDRIFDGLPPFIERMQQFARR